jgi:hypothetical protein
MCAFSIATAFQNNSLSLLVAAYLNGEMVNDERVWLLDFPNSIQRSAKKSRAVISFSRKCCLVSAVL